MAKIDLNIIDVSTEGTDWIPKEESIKAESLDKVLESKTDNATALNSLPTPFARFYVAREAFRRCQEEVINPKHEAGFAYQQLVSDILDVYELLFYKKYHEDLWKGKAKLELREWDSKENLAQLSSKMKVLYNSIFDYYNRDIHQPKLYFLIYTDESGKEKLLACSSPITGFITPPDMDRINETDEAGNPEKVHAGSQYRNLRIRRKSSGYYFDSIKLFQDRDADFKNYMFNSVFGADNIDDELKRIKDYIRQFKNDPDIRTNFKQRLKPWFTNQNEELTVNGLAISYSDETNIKGFFTDTLIRMPYRISSETYRPIAYKNDKPERDYDYLLPFKPEIVTLFSDLNIDAELHVRSGSIDVTLNYNGQEYKKTYKDQPDQGEGRILDLKVANIYFDLGLFPNILSPVPEENNYFKVMVAATDEDRDAPNFNIDKISLSFFKADKDGFEQIEEVNANNPQAMFGVRPAVVRSDSRRNSSQSVNTESGTKFYELFNTSFQLMEVNIMGDTGLLIPVWKQSYGTNDNYTYAIDLGTSNTFMSWCKNDAEGKPDTSREPEMFYMQQPMVSYVHEIDSGKQYPLVSRIEDSIFEMAKRRIKTEFAPAYIDGTVYRFPIRTAVCGNEKSANDPSLFDTHDIAFFYDKMAANSDEKVYTDIKWAKDQVSEQMLRIFIRELLLIVKCDILQRNGKLRQTRLIWFSPLSFSPSEEQTYKDIWTKEAKSILFIEPQRIIQYTESEAPYYYYKKKDDIKDSDAVTVIDIGGGSTDFFYFRDNAPVAANSVHFGCDVLWGNGFNEFGNARDNGIYKRYASSISFKSDQLNDLNNAFIASKDAKTNDIINFWLANANSCNIVKDLSRDFKPVFVYHMTAILYYMAIMYRDNGLPAPRNIVFSGNGSRYIDNFITSDESILTDIIGIIFRKVFGNDVKDVLVKLPDNRKESTCYGGMYRDRDAKKVAGMSYQGVKGKFHTLEDIDKNFVAVKTSLKKDYEELADLYDAVIKRLREARVIDGSNTKKYSEEAHEDMQTSLNTHFKDVKGGNDTQATYNDSIFFLPVIDRVFEMTKI